MNLDSREAALSSAAFDPADPTTYNGSTSAPIYDSLGNRDHAVHLFRQDCLNSWDLFAVNNGAVLNGGLPVGSLNFLSERRAQPVGYQRVQRNIAGDTGANPLAFDLDFTGTTQFGSSFGVNALSQDGYTSGQLTGYSVAPDGTIRGGYSNGEFLALGQIVMANFANPQGLEVRGNNTWKESATSGTALVSAPGSGGLGVLAGGGGRGVERGTDVGAGQYDHGAAYLSGKRPDHQDPGPDPADDGQPEVIGKT